MCYPNLGFGVPCNFCKGPLGPFSAVEGPPPSFGWVPISGVRVPSNFGRVPSAWTASGCIVHEDFASGRSKVWGSPPTVAGAPVSCVRVPSREISTIDRATLAIKVKINSGADYDASFFDTSANLASTRWVFFLYAFTSCCQLPRQP